MNKQKFFKSMHIATMEQNKWLSEVNQLISGYIDTDINYKKSFLDTSFYFWFKNIASNLLYEEGLEDLKAIEKLIYHMDGEYISLYNIAIRNRSKSFLGKYKPLESKDISALEKYHNALHVITEKIETLLLNLESKIKNKPEELFEFMTIIQEINTDNSKEEKKVNKKSISGARGAYQD